MNHIHKIISCFVLAAFAAVAAPVPTNFIYNGVLQSDLNAAWLGTNHNITNIGTATAQHFVGDGSGITGVTAGLATNVPTLTAGTGTTIVTNGNPISNYVVSATGGAATNAIGITNGYGTNTILSGATITNATVASGLTLAAGATNNITNNLPLYVLTNGTPYVAATNGIATNLIATNSMSIVGNGIAASLMLKPSGTGPISQLISSSGGLLISNNGSAFLFEGGSAVGLNANWSGNNLVGSNDIVSGTVSAGNITNTGRYDFSNAVTGANANISTNAHYGFVDEGGTINKSGTNGVWEIDQTNGSYVRATNGSLAVSGGITAQGSSTLSGSFSGSFAGNGASLTNLILQVGDVVVCPYTNLPAVYTNSNRYFGPWLGADYVAQAFRALPYATNYYNFEGGGRVWVVGNNFIPNTLMLTNATTNSASWDIEAPAFMTGAIITASNDCIDCICTNSTVQLKMKNVIISSLTDSTNFLLLVSNSCGRVDIEMNEFAPWIWVTNNYWGSLPNKGFTPPYGGPGQALGNLVGVGLYCGEADMVNFEKNSVAFCASGILWGVDHGACRDNFFTEVGGTNIGNMAVSPHWPLTSLFSLGCSIVLHSVQNNNWEFDHNEFYSGGYSYYVDLPNGGAYGANVASYFDIYEGNNAPYSEAMLVATNAGMNCHDVWNNSGPLYADPINAYLVSSSPYTVNGTLAPTGQVQVEIFDNNGFRITGPGLCRFQASPIDDFYGGSIWYDESGRGITLNGSGVIQGNGGGLTNLPTVNLSSNLVSGSSISNATIQSSTFTGTNNWTGDIAYPGVSVSSLASGVNAAVPISTNVYMRVSGPTGAFSINGVASGRDGRVVVFENATGYALTIANNSGSDPTATNRILTGTGADFALANNPGVATLIYDGNQSRWVLKNANSTLAPTHAAFSITQTNFIANTAYTNNSGYPQSLKASIAQTTAAVTGDVGMQLQIAGVGGSTNGSSISTTVAVTLAQTYTNMLSGDVPSGDTYIFTNLTTGSGNSASIVAGSGTVLQY